MTFTPILKDIIEKLSPEECWEVSNAAYAAYDMIGGTVETYATMFRQTLVSFLLKKLDEMAQPKAITNVVMDLKETDNIIP